MRTLRFVSGLLLMTDGVLHLVEYLNISDKPGSLGMLIFGLMYIAVGALLFNRRIYPVYLGIIVPLTGMTTSLIKSGIPELISLSALFKLIGLSVIICCSYLLMKHYRIGMKQQLPANKT